MTEYLVLTRPTGVADTSWLEVARVNATSAEQAVRKCEKEGMLVAVPARSWKPVRVTTETRTVLKLKADTVTETPAN